MAAKKGTKNLIKAKQTNYFSLLRGKGRNYIQKVLLEKYDEGDSIQNTVIIWYGMICYPMLCDGMEIFVCFEISLLFYGLCCKR